MSSREPYRYAVLLATRGRPWNMERLHAAIQCSAERPDLVDLWCYVDDDDPEGIDKYQATEVPAVWLTGPRLKLARTWNHLAERIAGDATRRVATRSYTHLLAWGDDVIPETLGWDRMFAESSAKNGPGIYYGLDGVWDHSVWPEHPEHLMLPTATAITVDAYRALGWIAPPGLVHLCIDLCWRDVAAAAGCLHLDRDIMIRHYHRMKGAPDDQTYRDANDDQEQKRTDALAHAAYVGSPRFQRDIEKLRGLMEHWRLTRAQRIFDVRPDV